MSKFGLNPQQYELIKKLLHVYIPDVKVLVFGSRARGDHKKYSDLDLALECSKPIDSKAITSLSEQFTESSLPFKVDLLELRNIDASFLGSIRGDFQVF